MMMHTFLLFVASVQCIDERIVQMAGWGFEIFKSALNYHRLNMFKEPALGKMMTSEQFQLVSQAMTTNDLIEDEFQVFCLFEIADEFRATRRALTRILSIFTNYLSHNYVEFPSEYKQMSIWEDFVMFVNQNSAVQISQGKVTIYGTKVTAESRQKTFVLANNLLQFYDKFMLACISIDAKDAPAVQRLFKPHLTLIHIEECPFNFDEAFDLSPVVKLKHFECSMCYASQIIRTLVSIKSKLTILNIEGNGVIPKDYDQLLEFFGRQEELQELNISNNQIGNSDLLKVILNIKQLKFLDISDNLIGPSFSFHLGEHPVLLELEHLDVSNIFYDDSQALIKFFKNFCKLSKLQVLHFCGNQIDKFMVYFVLSIGNLKSLLILTVDSDLKEKKMQPLLNYTEKHNIRLKTFPLEKQYIKTGKRVNYLRFTGTTFGRLQYDSVKNEDFYQLTELTFNFEFVSNEISNSKCLEIFEKFHSLEILSLTLNEEENLIFVAELFRNNPNIYKLILIFSCNFTSYAKLIEIIENADIKELTIDHSKENALFYEFVSCLSASKLVQNVADLELRGFTLPMMFDFLSIKAWNVTALKMLLIQEDGYEINGLQMPSVQFLKVQFSGSTGRFNEVLGIFPSLLSLQLSSNIILLDDIRFDKMNRLRKLKIDNYNPVNIASLLENISRLPFLMSLTLGDAAFVQNANNVKLFHFPQLLYLKIDGNYFTGFIFNAPWLRILKTSGQLEWNNNISLCTFARLKEMDVEFSSAEQFLSLFNVAFLCRYNELLICKLTVKDKTVASIKVDVDACMKSLAILSITGIFAQFQYPISINFPSIVIVNDKYYKDEKFKEPGSFFGKLLNYFY